MNEKNDKGGNNKPKRTPQQEQDLVKIITKRNKRLANLFKVMDLPVRIIGDENKPSIIYDDRIKIKAYVHNFELRFVDVDDDRDEDGNRKINKDGSLKEFDGNCIYMIKLLDIPVFDKDKVIECINHQPIFYINKILLNKINPLLPFYLTGYGYLNMNKGTIKYPVFATCSPKNLSSKEAQRIVEELKKDGYDCGITDNSIVLKNITSPLYLTGYNYLNREESLGRYPVFALYSPKVYFEENKANEVSDELKSDGYDCGVIGK